MGEESSGTVIGKMKEDCDKKENRPDDKKDAGGDSKVQNSFEKVLIHTYYYEISLMTFSS